LQFLDGLINPNVRLSVAEWFHFLDKAAAREKLAMRTEMNPRDTFNDRSVKLNGRVKLDGRTENTAVKFMPKLDGRFRADGGINLSGALLSEPAAGAARVPARLGRGILDRPGLAVKPGLLDGCGVDIRFAMRPQMGVFTAFPGVLETARIKVKTGPADCYGGVLAKLSIAARTGHLDGCGVDIRFAMRPQMGVLTAFPGVLETARIKVKTGPADCYGGVLAKLSIAARTGHLDGCTAGDRLNAGMRYCRRLGGRYRLDGSIKLNSGILYAAQEDL
jgi:hypothetical protein